MPFFLVFNRMTIVNMLFNRGSHGRLAFIIKCVYPLKIKSVIIIFYFLFKYEFVFFSEI